MQDMEVLSTVRPTNATKKISDVLKFCPHRAFMGRCPKAKCMQRLGLTTCDSTTMIGRWKDGAAAVERRRSEYIRGGYAGIGRNGDQHHANRGGMDNAAMGRNSGASADTFVEVIAFHRCAIGWRR